MRSIQSYCETLERGQFPVAGDERIDEQKFYNEEIFLGLRSSGINLKTLRQLYGEEVLAPKKKLLRELERAGLLRSQQDILSLTSKGYAVCDEISRTLLQETA